MTREVFHHAAYEAYPDLLAAARELVPLLTADPRALARRFIEVQRESHARYNRVCTPSPDEIAQTRARLAAFGVDVALPDAPAEGRWRFLVRSLDRLERVRELGGPVDMLREAFVRPAHDLLPAAYEPPGPLTWSRVSDLVHDAIMLATTTGDEVGLGETINELPEAALFFDRYPAAYSYWEIHGSPDPPEDPDLPEPLRYPADLWTTPAIALAEPFADAPVGSDGPATFQPPDRVPSAALHPALANACRAAAARGHALIGWVEVHP